MSQKPKQGPWGDYVPAIFVLLFVGIAFEYDVFDLPGEPAIVMDVTTFQYNSNKLPNPNHHELLDCGRKVQLGEVDQFPLVMLVSFPGSGNTWTRLLIEDVTGYYTGSVYWDKSLYDGGFIGEKEEMENGTTVVVKNHNVRGLSGAKGVVLLVRNPYDAITAEFNRKQSRNNGSGNKHIGSADLEKFNSTKWFQTVKGLSTKWLNLHSKYAEYSNANNLPMHVLFYENLKTNSTHEMGRVLNFMKKNYDFYPPDGLRRLNCLSKLEEINASFKRKKVPFGWEIYPKKDIKKIDDYITQVRSLFAANNYPELPNYYRYSTNLNHTLISGEKLKTLRENFNIGK